MQGPPPPPKRKNHKTIATYGVVGAGLNVARALAIETSSNTALEELLSANGKQCEICVIDRTPDSIIGRDVEINGEFQFDRLLRIDGKFQGSLLSPQRGDLIIGQSGCIISDTILAKKMCVEGGHVIGKIEVDELLISGHAVIKGDITCKKIEIRGPNAIIHGRANIHQLSPELVDEHDNIVTIIPKVAPILF